MTAAAVCAGIILLRRMSPADPGRTADRPPAEPAALSRLANWVPAPPTTLIGKVCAYAWAAPLTVVGCALGWMAGARVKRCDGVLLFTGARGLIGAILRYRGFAATTLGHAVVTTSTAPSRALLAHELVHARQGERLGILFGPIYVALLGRYGYRQHPMERAARRGADAATS